MEAMKQSWGRKYRIDRERQGESDDDVQDADSINYADSNDFQYEET